MTAITIFGAGAIGGCVGAYLARSGEDVLLVDKLREHVDAINANGVSITGFETFTARPRACTPDDLQGPLGLVFLAVKSQDTDAAIDVLTPFVGDDTVIVSLQNGINGPRIAARIGADRVVSAFVSFPADWQGPGHIEHGGAGNIWIGESDGQMSERLERIRALLSCAVNAQITDNIMGFLWAKQIDCSLLFAQAATHETFASLYGNRRYQPLLVALLGEGLAVARAADVRLATFDGLDLLRMQPRNEAEAEDAMVILTRFGEFWAPRVKVRSGPWRDLAVRKRATEVDHMVGWVVAEGHRRGMALPLNERLVAIIKEIEAGSRTQELANLDELDALRVNLYAPHVGSLSA